MRKKSNVPAIRFAGFTDTWEQRKLEEVCTSFEYGLNAAAKEYDGKNKYIRITDIDDETRIFSHADLTSPDIDLKGVDNYLLQDGDIVFARTGASVGKTYIYRYSDGLVYYAGFLIRARIKNEYCADFIFQNTLTKGYEKYIQITSQRSGQPGVNAQEYAEFSLFVPQYAEQVKIGSFFRHLDHLITLHQRKYLRLRNIKKFMLEKTFPKIGNVVPEIRFAGFTDIWKMHKLGDFTDIKTGPFGSALHADDYVNDGIPIITTEHFKKGQLPMVKDGIPQVSNDDYLRLSSYMLKTGDIVFSRVGSVDINALVTEFQDKWLFSGRVLRVRPYTEVDNAFLHTLLETENVRNDITSRAVGQTMPSINTEILKVTSLCLPQNVDEQQIIGKYFLNLDYLIALYQHKLECLQNIKKACLEKMFV